MMHESWLSVIDHEAKWNKLKKHVFEQPLVSNREYTGEKYWVLL